MTACEDVEPTKIPSAGVAPTRMSGLVRRPIPGGYSPVVVALSVVTAVVAVLVASSAQVRHQVTISLVPQPERFTELYFTGGGPAGHSANLVDVPFTMINQEGRSMTYDYVIDAVDKSGKLLAQRVGAAHIPDQRVLETTVTLETPALAEWWAVNVALTGRTEHIRFIRKGVEAASS